MSENLSTYWAYSETRLTHSLWITPRKRPPVPRICPRLPTNWHIKPSRRPRIPRKRPLH